MTENRTFKAAILSSGKFLVTLTTLLCAAVLSRIFTKADYAAYRQTILAYKFVEPLLALGLPLALYYFLPRNKENGRSILSGNLVLSFLMGFVFAIAMWCGGNELLAKRFNNPVLSRLLLIYSPYAMFALPIAATSACLVCSGKVKTLAVFNVTSRILVFACIIGLVLVWRTPSAAVGGMVFAEFVLFVPAIFLMYRSTSEGDWRPGKSNMLEQVKYSVPLGLGTMLGAICFSIDKVVVSSMCPPEDFAIYANGAMQIPLIGIVTGSVTAILLPDITKMYKEGQFSDAISLWKRSAVKCAMIILPMMCLFFCLAPQFMSVIFSDEYLDSAHPFRFYLSVLPVRIVTFTAMIMASGKNHLILIRSVVDLCVNIILSLVFVYFFGYIGAVVGTIMMIYLWHVPFNLIVISRAFQTKLSNIFPYAQLLKIFFISLLACVIFLPIFCGWPQNNLLSLMIFAPAYIACVCLSFIRCGFLKWDTLVGFFRRITSN